MGAKGIHRICFVLGHPASCLLPSIALDKPAQNQEKVQPATRTALKCILPTWQAITRLSTTSGLQSLQEQEGKRDSIKNSSIGLHHFEY
eukprot:1954364-Amphidinium_carterae.2